MNRLEHVRQIVDEILPQQPDPEQRRCGYVHMYGVSAICVLLALKRGLDPEICGCMGMLHDIWNYKVGPNRNHARLGLPDAERILKETGFTPDEIIVICTAISHHSDKANTHSELDELLKDADVFQHHLYNPALEPPWQENKRLVRVFGEFGLDK